MYFLFTLLSVSFDTKIFVSKFFKKKIVILKSPFHFKISKHHVMYGFYTLSLILNLSKFIFFKIKYLLLLFFYTTKKHSLTQTHVFNLTYLIL